MESLKVDMCTSPRAEPPLKGLFREWFLYIIKIQLIFNKLVIKFNLKSARKPFKNAKECFVRLDSELPGMEILIFNVLFRFLFIFYEN